MNLSFAEISAMLGAYLLPLFRIGGMLMVAPIFSSNFVNVRTRLIIALAITFVVVPTINTPTPVFTPLSGEGILLIAQEVMIGICMGFMLQLLMNAFIVAGQIVAMQMGLGFASMVDPQNGTTVPVISQFYLIFITLMFLSINGHLVLIQVMAESFITLPIGAGGISVESFRDIAGLASWMYAAGVIIALPAIGSLMMVNLAFGILSRAAPQISPFSIGFPLTIGLGFVIIYITLPAVGNHLVNFSDQILQMTRMLVMNNG